MISSDGAGLPAPGGAVGREPSVRDGRGVDGKRDSDEHEQDGDGGDHGWFRSGLGVDGGAGIDALHLVEGGAQAVDLLFDGQSSSGSLRILTSQLVFGGVNPAKVLDAVGHIQHKGAEVAVGFRVDGPDLEAEVGGGDARDFGAFQPLDLDLTREVCAMHGRRGQRVEVAGEGVSDDLCGVAIHCQSLRLWPAGRLFVPTTRSRCNQDTPCIGVCK